MTFVARLRQVAIAELLVSAGQQPIFSAWDAPGKHDAETCCNNMGNMIVRSYLNRAGKTLEDKLLHLCLCCFACSKGKVGVFQANQHFGSQLPRSFVFRFLRLVQVKLIFDGTMLPCLLDLG